MEYATAGGLNSSRRTTADQKGKQKKKINNDVSIISQPTRTKNQEISKNINKRKGARRRRTSCIPSTISTLDTSLTPFKNGSTRPTIQFRLTTSAASTSVTGHANTIASSNEPDVISLSDEEGSENLEPVTELALLDQCDYFTKQLQTSPLIKKKVLKCLTASDELERQRLINNAISEKTDNANVENEDNLTSRNKEQIKVGIGGREKKHFTIEVPLRSGPLLVRKDSFDGFNLIPGTHKFVQNGEVELKIEKPEGKDFIELILFECCGPLEDPKQVARGGYKICASAVLHENTSVEVIREALNDLAEQLERISHDSFYPGKKLPYSVSRYSLSYLEKQYIYPLKKKSSRFPRAIYYCGLCQYHICSVSQAIAHFLSLEHTDNREKAESLKKLGCLPGPAREQMFKVNQIIRELYIFTRLADVQYEVGSQIATLLSHFLQNEAHKSYSVMVYGSYLTRLATPHSNLNLALNFPLEYSLGYALSRVMEVLDNTTLGKDFTVHSITSDFQRPDPSVRCIINSVAVVITTNCVRQQRATQLINLYCAICSQFRILATVFRSWAELCSLTNVQLGGIPKLAFDIILIYYLQRKGLLPFVFEILDEEEIMLLDSGSLEFEHQVDKINTDFGTGSKEWDFGKIWIDLFRYYTIEHPVEELIQIRLRKRYVSEECIRWNKKRLAVEDPFAPDHIMQPQQRINGYFSSCFLSTYFYFALPRTVVCSLIPYSVISPETADLRMKKKRKRRSKKTMLLNDSCCDESAANNDQQNNKSGSDDVDVRSLEATQNRIMEADMSKQEITTVIENGLETTTGLWTNRDEIDENLLASGKCKDLEMPLSDPTASCLDLNTSHNNLKRDDADETCCNHDLKATTLQQHNFCFSELSLEKDELAETRLANAAVLKIKFHDYDEMAIRKLWLALNNNEYDYPWALHCFTGGLEPAVRCTCCNADGHLRENCPELMIPKPKNFPPLTNARKKIIDLVISDIFNTMRIRPYYVHHMLTLCRELESWLRRFYRTDCHLSLFGSAGNGFGLLGSDADICLRFGPEVRSEDIDSAEVICKVAEVIRKMPNITFVYEIPHAKVPIVKFRCRNHYHLEADVSLYNVLALENTRLLRTYSKLDRRIHQLGIMTKMWAKNCEIGNASKGSLSSYSYIIMLIHYLQRTNPPVAPFLQELVPPGRYREPVIIDDCDVYFCSFEDLKWTIHNRSTVGELWIGFLDYFGTKFDFTREVIQIRQTLPLLKLDKGWQSRPIAIEDPFDLTHNLSSGVHSKTMAYIQKSFILSWEKFNTLSVPNSKLNHNSLMLYASVLLSDCRVGSGPPLDCNCCHRCRQVGHFVMDCPLGLKDKKLNK
ncbi:PAP/25A associated domain-containing protein [Loa loa]|uniref:PAP/25A associated domain-containing protein n=1 Tax=Loa loa TaxID=7209 RepID=A0A1I7VSY0_LOALO|nr:PAP/25A associated domain-containing protein [Loa loa]EJD74988.1 PAP/25A associated domain-containing protein [Loa loa]